MTWGLLSEFRALYGAYFYENGIGCERISEYRNVDMVVMDSLAFIRNIRTVSKMTGRVLTGREFMEKIFAEPFEILKQTNVETVVMCVDTYGRFQPEKERTKRKRKERDDKRVEKGSLREVEDKTGTGRYFELDKELPATSEEFMRDPKSKRCFFDFLTLYVIDEEFIRRIPPGKKFILWGGVTLSESKRGHDNLPPIAVTMNGYYRMEGVDDKNIVEADLAVWMWVQHFAQYKTVVVDSNDGDGLMIGLIQNRMIHQHNDQRRIWFKTRRAVGQGDEYDEDQKAIHNSKADIYHRHVQETGDKQTAYKLSEGVTAHITTRHKPCFATIHVDLTGLWLRMEDQGMKMKTKFNLPAPWFIPEEVVCLFGLLADADNDYFNRGEILYGVGAKNLVNYYNAFRFNIGATVTVSERDWDPALPSYRSESSPGTSNLPASHRSIVYSSINEVASSSSSSSTTSSSSSSTSTSPPNRKLLTYHVDVNALKQLVSLSYEQQARSRIKKEGKTEEKYEQAVSESQKRSLSKINESAYHGCAARISWILHYYGLQFCEGSSFFKGTCGYGYDSNGHTNDVEVSDIHSCPRTPTSKPSKSFEESDD